MLNVVFHAPVQRHGYAWNVTFVDVLNSGDVPSLLVSTNGGLNVDTVATGSYNGGSVGLTGTSPKVEVTFTINISCASSFFGQIKLFMMIFRQEDWW